ncbi:hypothetical protein [Acidovorax sp. NCPPB 4044]|uniref:hypothetical protein n=1 Tax=Acidovorax sp. NCPPB 4044 TaxID=2940490 RepID=UPI0023039CEF|nr:hypothetical protein [Acidovorax sp. NCPPB 4044]MDA8522415.1 hypothetical protein [Acidovorax sp. NCPPB 4044]
MRLLQRYKELMDLAGVGDFSELESFSKYLKNNYSLAEDVDEFCNYLIGNYEHLSVALKISLLDIFSRLDSNMACRLVEKDLSNAYRDFRHAGSKVHQILLIISQSDGVRLPTISIEFNKNMEIALLLLSGKSLKHVLNS